MRVQTDPAAISRVGTFRQKTELEELARFGGHKRPAHVQMFGDHTHADVPLMLKMMDGNQDSVLNAGQTDKAGESGTHRFEPRGKGEHPMYEPSKFPIGTVDL